MNYIVLDLEWNQNPHGNRPANALLPFEIIEIGAVKMDEERRIVDTFHRLIKPSVYHWIQDSVHQVIHVNYRDLRKGTPFPDAVEAFMQWCGQDFRFCTWAKQDVMELQRNMRYYYMLDLLPGPVVYYDVQKLYSLSFEDGKIRRSLEAVIDQQGLPKDKGFHRALADAWYTAEIMAMIDPAYLTGYESVDAFQNPKSKEEEYYFSSGGAVRYISREFRVKERVIQDKEVSGIRCPICDRSLSSRGEADWIQANAKAFYSLESCRQHGEVAGLIRIRKTEAGKYFASKTMRVVGQEEAADLRLKLALLLEKKGKK